MRLTSAKFWPDRTACGIGSLVRVDAAALRPLSLRCRARASPVIRCNSRKNVGNSNGEAEADENEDNIGSRSSKEAGPLSDLFLEGGCEATDHEPDVAPGDASASEAAGTLPATAPTAPVLHDGAAGRGEKGLPLVPWGGGKILQVMGLWLLAYILIGQVAVPALLMLLGIDRDNLSLRGHAILHLCLDVSQLGVTLLILWRCLKEFRPRQLGLFPVQWRGAWPLLVLLGCLVFPCVDWVAQQSMSWFQTDADLWTNQMELNLSMGDWITNVAYFCVVSICAPIWEEAIFRGFLLASLARFMPTGAAVIASSLLFAMCHFRLQTFLPLLMLGIVFSCTFLATRNLLPPIALHSAWNIYVLCNLVFRPA